MTERPFHTCAITGATSGIGRALALELTRRGARVWAVGRSRDKLDALAAVVETSEGEVRPILADLEREGDVVEVGRQILAQEETLDVLVHSAGAIALGPFDAVPPDELDRMYRVNLRAPYALTQGLLPALRRARGQVVFVNSSAGLQASGENALYAATKHGLKALADGLRDTVNPEGIRVISVYLGRTATPMQEAVHAHEGREYRPELLLDAGDAIDAVISALSVPPSGEVTDVHLRAMTKLDG